MSRDEAEALTSSSLRERIKYPLIKNKETGEFERATWDEALDLVASKFMEIKKKYGPEFPGWFCLLPFPERGYLHGTEDGPYLLRYQQYR